MIVTCPACDTRYRVPDNDLGGSAGRRVRCANCGNLWHYSPEAAAIHAAIAETAAARDSAGTAGGRAPAPPSLLVTEAERPVPLSSSSIAAPTLVEPRLPPPRPEPVAGTPAEPPLGARPAVAAELPSATRRRRRHIVEFLLLVFVIAAVVVVALSRDRLVQLVPSIGPVLARLHLTDTSTAGLTVTVSPSRNGDALVIDGDITNGANVTRQLPRLRVALRDGNKEEVGYKEVEPPVAELAPGAKAHFTTTFDRPNPAASGVAVTFTTE